jgi:hypothetical protein
VVTQGVLQLSDGMAVRLLDASRAASTPEDDGQAASAPDPAAGG